MIGKLKPVKLREIWEHEAKDFTSWLFEHCDVLNEQIGLSVTPIEKEKSVGPFSADILAVDSNGKHVVIENQLERTDHDHLGKILTYLSNTDAKIAIWISATPRPEHITAIDYLNEIAPADTKFYLLKLQAFSIGNSKPAPLFTVKAGPTEERSAVGKIKKQIAEGDEIRYEYFDQLLKLCNQKTNLFSNVSPVGYQSWITAGAGKAGLGWSFVASKKNARVELFICGDAGINKKRFDKLALHKKQIEKSFGESLSWEFSNERKQQYIRSNCPYGGIEDDNKWGRIQSDLVDRMIRLEKALRPYINDLG